MVSGNTELEVKRIRDNLENRIMLETWATDRWVRGVVDRGLEAGWIGLEAF